MLPTMIPQENRRGICARKWSLIGRNDMSIRHSLSYSHSNFIVVLFGSATKTTVLCSIQAHRQLVRFLPALVPTLNDYCPKLPTCSSNLVH